jgi:hypothetical protein
MSIGSLSVLARLAGAGRSPSPHLYRDGWPGQLRRAGQLAFSAAQWSLHRRDAMILLGKNLPAAHGLLQVASKLRLRDWLSGAYVMGGASPSRLASNLGLDASPAPGLYLADADVLVVLGCRQGAPVVIHVAQDAQRVNRYRQSADQARQQLASAALSHLVPAVMEQRTVLDLTMLVQQRLVGQTLRPSDLSAEQLERYVNAALQPLRALALGSSVAAEGADHGLVSQELNWLESHPQLGAAVRRPLAALRDWPGRRQHPAVLAHGDYCFPNLLFEPGSPRLAGLIDWERSRPRACAGFDALYLVLFCFSAWRGGSPMRVLCMLWDNLCEPVLERLLAEAGLATGLDIEDLRHVGLLIWLLHLSRHGPQMQDWSDAHRRDWLAEPADSAQRWLARSGQGRSLPAAPRFAAPA